MKSQGYAAILPAVGLLLGLTACGSDRMLGDSAANRDDFSNCVNKECFAGLRSIRLIESEPQHNGAERVIYATWSGTIWKNHIFVDPQQPRYLYFEAQFDASGSVSRITVGEPVCFFDDNYERNCIIQPAE